MPLNKPILPLNRGKKGLNVSQIESKVILHHSRGGKKKGNQFHSILMRHNLL